MNNIFEFCTYSNSPQAKEAERIAVENGKKHKGNKFVVAIGEWGTKTYLVLTETKEEARQIAIDYQILNYPNKATDKIKVRDVTNAKKYN